MRLLLCLSIVFLFSKTTLAESFIESFQETPLKEGEVLVEKQEDVNASYKDRRTRHGALLSINYEKYYPTDYFSILGDVYIEDMIGDTPLNLIGVEFGYKLNFALGSLSFLGGYSQGNAKGSVDSVDRYLKVSRQGASIGFALDNLLREPWIVPYGQVGAHQFLIEEEDNVDSSAATTALSLNYKVGLLFQLNWIESYLDPNSHAEGLRSSGLENTFLDVYAMAHMSSNDLADPNVANSEGDPDMKSNAELGIGLKMEF